MAALAGPDPGEPAADVPGPGSPAADLRGPGSRARALRIGIVAANTFEHESRLLRTGRALADDGHHVMVLAFAAPGLPSRETLGERLELRRLPVDRRVTSAFRPLPPAARAGLARALGFPEDAVSLPPRRAHGADRLRAPLRRGVEILAHQRRVGPWRDAVLAALPDADVYHCKSLVALPVVAGAAARSRPASGVPAGFAYDLADLHTEAARLARMPGVVRRMVRRREAAWARRAALLTAVSEGVAEEASRRFRVGRPVVVLNCPPAWRASEAGPPASTRLRDATGIGPGRPIVLYQGGFSVDRGIEELVAALDEPPLRDLDAAVVLLGYGRLRERLLEGAARRPGRLYVLEAVPPAELLEWTASADLGYVGQPARTLNQRLNLANKLFECIMAGVPVLAAEGTEHCRVVTAEGLGACSAIEPAAIARAVADLLARPAPEQVALRTHVRRVALERYTWELQQSGLVGAYRALADRRHDGASGASGASVTGAGGTGAAGAAGAGR
jgi:glycosyltransferase involved in cell wall biosynthesis